MTSVYLYTAVCVIIFIVEYICLFKNEYDNAINRKENTRSITIIFRCLILNTRTIKRKLNFFIVRILKLVNLTHRINLLKCLKDEH